MREGPKLHDMLRMDASFDELWKELFCKKKQMHSIKLLKACSYYSFLQKTNRNEYNPRGKE